jgi:hypothetical protein
MARLTWCQFKSLATGQTKFPYAGLDVEVITAGRYKGFLIGTKDKIIEDRGRITVYWLLDSDGKEVQRIGESEGDQEVEVNTAKS